MLGIISRPHPPLSGLRLGPLITRSTHDARSPKEWQRNRYDSVDSRRHSFRSLRSPAFRDHRPYGRDSGPGLSTKDRLGDKWGQDKDGASTECGDVEGHDITQRNGWGQRAELSRERGAIHDLQAASDEIRDAYWRVEGVKERLREALEKEEGWATAAFEKQLGHELVEERMELRKEVEMWRREVQKGKKRMDEAGAVEAELRSEVARLKVVARHMRGLVTMDIVRALERRVLPDRNRSPAEDLRRWIDNEGPLPPADWVRRDLLDPLANELLNEDVVHYDAELAPVILSVLIADARAARSPSTNIEATHSIPQDRRLRLYLWSLGPEHAEDTLRAMAA